MTEYERQQARLEEERRLMSDFYRRLNEAITATRVALRFDQAADKQAD